MRFLVSESGRFDGCRIFRLPFVPVLCALDGVLILFRRIVCVVCVGYACGKHTADKSAAESEEKRSICNYLFVVLLSGCEVFRYVKKWSVGGKVVRQRYQWCMLYVRPFITLADSNTCTQRSIWCARYLHIELSPICWENRLICLWHVLLYNIRCYCILCTYKISIRTCDDTSNPIGILTNSTHKINFPYFCYWTEILMSAKEDSVHVDIELPVCRIEMLARTIVHVCPCVSVCPCVR